MARGKHKRRAAKRRTLNDERRQESLKLSLAEQQQRRAAAEADVANAKALIEEIETLRREIADLCAPEEESLLAEIAGLCRECDEAEAELAREGRRDDRRAIPFMRAEDMEALLRERGSQATVIASTAPASAQRRIGTEGIQRVRAARRKHKGGTL